MTTYSIEEEMAFLFDQSQADTFALIKAHEVHRAMWEGKLYGVDFFPQYADAHGFLADLEPSYALSLANRTNRHFGVASIDQATAIEELTRSMKRGETPQTSKALARLGGPGPVSHRRQRAAAEDVLTANAQPQGRVMVYRNAGRPTLYPERKRTTVELTYDLIDALNALRGDVGMGTFIEEILRRDPGIAARLERKP
jgi:hypothetical protein